MSIWNSITSPISSVGSYFSQSSSEEQQLQQQQQSLSQSSRSNDGNQQSGSLKKQQQQQYYADNISHLLQQPSPCWVLLSDQTLDPDDVPEWQTHDFKKSTATQVQQAQYYFLMLHHINSNTSNNKQGDSSKDQELHLYDAIPSISSKSQQPVMRINLSQYKCLLFPHNLHVSMMYDRKLPILLQSTAPDNRQSSDRYALRSEHYIWFPTAMFKEDWYLSLRMRMSSYKHPQQQQLKLSHRSQEIEYSRILANDYSQSAQMNVSYNHEDLTTAWFNALLVRVFPSIVRFEEFNMYIEELLTRKFQLMRTPDFMDDLSLKNFSIDSQPPVLSNAELVQASADGHTEIKFNAKYDGRFEVEAEMNLNLNRMNNNISLLLPKMSIPARVKISLTRLEGRMLVLIKKNPSNRLWFGFTEMPRVYVDISPMINLSKNNELSLDYAIIVQFLQDKFMTVIREELVYPHMGDVDIPGNSESFDYLFTPGNQGFTSLINDMKLNKQIKKKVAATKGGNGQSSSQQEEQNPLQSVKHKRVTSAPMPNSGRYKKLSDQISHKKHLKQQSMQQSENNKQYKSSHQQQDNGGYPHVDLRHDQVSSMGSSAHRRSRSFEGNGADFVDEDSLSYTLSDNLHI
ncbi:hypothetical protein MP228_010412 [Amoeboaphelidium protococcarum]|nr:hypothetical protein MP228_010412 [Amoeboaphelidium protococcarum]